MSIVKAAIPPYKKITLKIPHAVFNTHSIIIRPFFYDPSTTITTNKNRTIIP